MKRIALLIFLTLAVLSFSGCSFHEDIIEVGTIDLDGVPLDELRIEVPAGSLRVHITQDKPYLDYTLAKSGFIVGDPELEVRQSVMYTTIGTRNFPFGFGGSFSYSIDLYIPAGAVDSLAIELVSGDAELRDIILRELAVELTSGDFNAEDVSAGHLRLDVNSGAASVSGVFGSVSVDVTSGDFDIECDMLPLRIDCEMTSGDMLILLPDDPAGFKLEYQVTGGSVDCRFPVTTSPAGEGRPFVYGQGYCDITVNVTSGNVVIDGV